MKGYVEAILSTDEHPLYLLDTVMGNVCPVESKEMISQLIPKIGKKNRYVPIASFKDQGYTSLMEQFLDGVVGAILPSKFTDRLKNTLQKKGWKAVVKMLERGRDGEEWFIAWNQFIQNEAADFADFLLSDMSGEINPCANCPICQAIRGGGGS